MKISQELIGILMVGAAVIASYLSLDSKIWELNKEIDDLRGRPIKLETANSARITGKVTVAGGASPDIMVVASRLLSGIEDVLTDNKGTYTDTAGRYAFDSLRPGAYKLTFTSRDLLGTREVEVSAGFKATVDAELQAEGD